jgi:hypothetical protein
VTAYRGLLLFDYPDPPIGPWENQLGYRGVKEVYRKKDTNQYVEIDFPDDEYQEWEAWWHDDDTGAWEVFAWGAFEECEDAAKEWMSNHQ